MKKEKIKNIFMKKKPKALIMFSGGLDSRVTSKFMEELGFEIHLMFVRLPFGSGCGNFEGIEEFAFENKFKLIIVDASKGKLLKEYLELIQNPKYGYGKGMNPCKDCKIFIFKRGKNLAKKIKANVICSGEVLGQRPMSQMKKSLLLDEDGAGLKGKILRPLSAKLLPETDYEKEKIIDREKLLEIQGRQRNIQMKLAKKYGISYPSPGGGCLLCEKIYSRKLKVLFENKNEPLLEEIYLLKKGRMFKVKGFIFVGRFEEENSELISIAKKLKWGVFFEKTIKGPTVIYENQKDLEIVKNLWHAYSKGDLKARKKFEKWII